MKKLFVLIAVAFQVITVAKAQEKMVVESTDGSTTEFNVDEVSRVYFKEDVALNCRLLPNFSVPFTDGFATSWTAEDNVFISYVKYFTKEQFDSFQGDKDVIINEILKNNEGRTLDGYVSWSTGIFWEPDKDYVLCTISYNSEGKSGQLVTYPFKTLSTGLPVAEISNLSIANYGNEYWKLDVTMKNGATMYYIAAYITESIYNYDKHYVAWLLRNRINNYSDEVETSTKSSLMYQRSEDYLTPVTWAVDANGNIGNYSHAKLSATSQSPAKVKENKNLDYFTGSIKFDESHLKSFKIIKAEK